jgi:hypothetical protein
MPRKTLWRCRTLEIVNRIEDVRSWLPPGHFPPGGDFSRGFGKDLMSIALAQFAGRGNYRAVAGELLAREYARPTKLTHGKIAQ